MHNPKNQGAQDAQVRHRDLHTETQSDGLPSKGSYTPEPTELHRYYNRICLITYPPSYGSDS